MFGPTAEFTPDGANNNPRRRGLGAGGPLLMMSSPMQERPWTL